MRSELQKKIMERFSSRFSGAFECGDGWFDLINGLLHEINCICERDNLDCKVTQIKEKFGSLRVYMDTETDEISDAITAAENRSESICERCGAPGEMRGTSWMHVSCNGCDKK